MWTDEQYKQHERDRHRLMYQKKREAEGKSYTSRPTPKKIDPALDKRTRIKCNRCNTTILKKNWNIKQHVMSIFHLGYDFDRTIPANNKAVLEEEMEKARIMDYFEEINLN